MKKVLNKDKYFQIFLISILLFNPIIDLVTSFSIRFIPTLSSLGIIIRIMILVIIISYSFTKDILKDKISLFLFGFIIIYLIFYALNVFLTKDNTLLLNEMIQYSKIIYFPTLFITLSFLVREANLFKIKIKHIVISVLIYSLCILIPYFTNTAFVSYDHSKIGFVGWFYAANQIGNIIAISIPFVFEYLIREKNKMITKIFIIFLVLASIIVLGTKTPVLSLAIVLFVYYIRYFIKSIKNNADIKIFIGSTLAIVALLIIIPITPFYKNMITHYNFQQVSSLKEIITNPTKLDHFVFGERFKFLNDTREIYSNSNISSKILGIGYYDSQTKEEYKTIEMDFADTIYRTGSLMFLFIYGIIPIIFLSKINSNPKKVKECFPYYLSLILALLISVTAGHVFTAPSVSLYVIIIMMMLYQKKVKE